MACEITTRIDVGSGHPAFRPARADAVIVGAFLKGARFDCFCASLDALILRMVPAIGLRPARVTYVASFQY